MLYRRKGSCRVGDARSDPRLASEMSTVHRRVHRHRNRDRDLGLDGCVYSVWAFGSLCCRVVGSGRASVQVSVFFVLFRVVSVVRGLGL